MSKQQIKDQLFEEFEYKQKAGTAWSHNFLNQKPWHPLSYPNQRRKWIAEQMHGMTEKRKAEVEKEVRASEGEVLLCPAITLYGSCTPAFMADSASCNRAGLGESAVFRALFKP